jgi:hypothetical protein
MIALRNKDAPLGIDGLSNIRLDSLFFFVS